jgi:hypothetical protein
MIIVVHTDKNAVKGTDRWLSVPLQSAGHFLDIEALDYVADLDVLVILEGHAAFMSSSTS